MSGFSVTSFPAISGGLPTQPDFAPSIVFIVAYVIVLLPALWRTYTYRRPGALLFAYGRFVLFLLIRVATFALRVDEAQTDSIPLNPVPNLAVFIVEQIFLGIGFIIMVEFLVNLLESHITRTDMPPKEGTHSAVAQQAPVLQAIVNVMQVALIAAIALGIAAGAMYSSALDNPNQANLVRSLRVASTVIALAIAAIIFLISILLLAQWPHLGTTRTAYLLVASALLVIVPAYRLSTSLTQHPSLEDLISTATRVEFYVLQATMEWLVAALFVAVDVRVWFCAGGREAQMMLGRGQPQGNWNGQAQRMMGPSLEMGQARGDAV